MTVRLAAALAVLMTAAGPAIADDAVLGRWLTPGASAVVELAPCADAATLCGSIRWLWDAIDDKGQPRLDSQNADTSLRGRPLLGLAVLSGLVPQQGGGWQGRIYNPEDGQTYRASVSKRDADTLIVEGCALFVCRQQVWRRASSLAEAIK